MIRSTLYPNRKSNSLAAMLALGAMPLLALAAMSAPAAGQNGATPSTNHSANVGYLYGFNWDSPKARRDILTFEYANRWAYGDNFFFVDVTNLVAYEDAPGVGIGGGATAAYGEWQPRISLSRLTGRDLRAGPIRDVLTAHEVNFSGGGFLAHLHGIGLDWDAPGFTFLKTNLYLRDDRTRSGATWQVLVAWSVPFRVTGVDFTFGGFADIVGAEGAAPANLFTGTQLLLDLGRLASTRDGTLYLGTEFHFTRNQGGVSGLHQAVPQAMLKWIF